jgi:signal peptidase I
MDLAVEPFPDMPSSRPPPSDVSSSPRPTTRDNIATFVLALVAALSFRTGVAQAYEVDGPSMEPTVFQGERVVALRCAYGLSVPFVTDAVVMWSTPAVGDVVIVESPAADRADLVKRVVGVAGDVISIENGVVMRNGEPFRSVVEGRCDPSRELDPSADCTLAREQDDTGTRSWLTSRSQPSALESMAPLEVPEGHVFVMGDHRDRSNDSRYLGPIPVTRVRGRVLFVQ